MCRFIIAVLPAGTDTEALRGVFRAHGRGFDQYANPALSGQLGRGECCFLTTPGHCDCGTPLGASCENDADAARDRRKAHIGRLRRRGWSEARIARALSQHDEAVTRERGYPGHATPPTSLAQWLALLDESLTATRTPWLGLMLNMYGGNVESEQLELLGRESVERKRRTGETLAAMREGVLYEFQR